MSTTDFMGRDGFIWFAGVVEDRNDPLKLGRVRVRCLLSHEDKIFLRFDLRFQFLLLLLHLAYRALD